jgi:hypothetical protein
MRRVKPEPRTKWYTVVLQYPCHTCSVDTEYAQIFVQSTKAESVAEAVLDIREACFESNGFDKTDMELSELLVLLVFEGRCTVVADSEDNL